MTNHAFPQSGDPGTVRFAWIAYAYTILVILWGAFVRATGSGAGCGSHWPLCNGEIVPRSPSLETVIEFTHRFTSGIAFLMVVWLMILVFRRFPTGHSARKAAATSLFFMVTEALLGAGLVLFGLVGDNDTLARAWVMAFHLVNTFLLLGAMALTAWWAGGRPALQLSGKGAQISVSVALLAILLLVGMSGAVAALGDTLFPAVSLAEGLGQDFDPESHILIRLRIYHPALALLSFLAMLACLNQLLKRTGPATRRLGMLTLGALISQLLIGLVNLWLLAPVGLQLVHLLGADLLWTLAVLFVASGLGRET